MQNASKLLEMATYIIMFCMAVTIFLSHYRGLNNLIVSAKNEISSQNIYYEKERSLEEIMESRISYCELISTLFGNLDYNIMINDITILKDTYNYQEFDFSTVPHVEYTKSYQYDSYGNIVKVIYTS